MAGVEISHAGMRSLRCSIILDGFLATSKTMPNGKLQIIAFHIPGDMPDLLSLHLEVPDSDIRAISDCTLAYMANSDLYRLCNEHPRLGDVLWRDTVVEVAIAREWIVSMGQRQAVSRIAHLLCEMMTRMKIVGRVFDGTCLFDLTQKNLSDATGLSVVHVNRTLQELRARNLISFGQGMLTIHDWDRLVRLADFRSDYLHQQPPMSFGLRDPTERP
jgi:CRP-like cAMP-binding protein